MSRRCPARRSAAALCLSLISAMPALAHKPSDSYLRLSGAKDTTVQATADPHLTAQWDLSLKDLDFLIGLDADGDSRITWGEVKARRQAIVELALAHLHLAADGRDVPLRVTDLLINRHSDGTYATLVIDTDAPADAAEIDLRYSLLFEQDPTHRGVVLYHRGRTASTHILSPDQPNLHLDAGEAGPLRPLLTFARAGARRFYAGLDHALFLLALLLPAALVHSGGRWAPAPGFRAAALEISAVVGCFALAHSVTLWLAATGYLTLPGPVVGVAVAGSVFVAAALNLLPRLRPPGYALAFALGLLHGFALTLHDLGLNATTPLLATVGFNLGLGLATLALALGAAPILLALRRTGFYRWGVLQLGSVLILLLATLWLVERLFDLNLVAF